MSKQTIDPCIYVIDLATIVFHRATAMPAQSGIRVLSLLAICEVPSSFDLMLAAYVSKVNALFTAEEIARKTAAYFGDMAGQVIVRAHGKHAVIKNGQMTVTEDPEGYQLTEEEREVITELSKPFATCICGKDHS